MRTALKSTYEEEDSPDLGPIERSHALYSPRLPALDGLRGLAVIEVFLYHARTPTKNSGWIGVELFLALSGFVITRSLLSEWFRTGTVSVLSFLKRRAARIYPALLFLLTSYIILGTLIFKRGPIKLFSEVGPSFLGLANWTRAIDLRFPRDLGHLWSLSVELQLYLVTAPIVIFLLRRSLKSLILGTSFIAGLCLLYRYYLIHNGEPSVFIYNHTICRALPYLFGSVAAALTFTDYELKNLSREIKLLVVSVFLAALLFHFYELRYCSLSQWGRRNWNPLLVSLSAAVIVWGTSIQVIPLVSRFFSNRVMHYLGCISYGTFLWHYPIIFLFPRGDATVRFIVALILSLVLGAISFELIEKRFIKKNVGSKF